MSTTLRAAQTLVDRFHHKHGFARNLLHERPDPTVIPQIGQQAYDNEKLAWLARWNQIGVARAHLIIEETGELLRAWHDHDVDEIADGLGDLLYVVLGSAVAAGIDLAPIFEEIAESNLTKDVGTGAELHPTKGPDYNPPNLRPILEDMGL